jgi:hypothetical protein
MFEFAMMVDMPTSCNANDLGFTLGLSAKNPCADHAGDRVRRHACPALLDKARSACRRRADLPHHVADASKMIELIEARTATPFFGKTDIDEDDKVMSPQRVERKQPHR